MFKRLRREQNPREVAHDQQLTTLICERDNLKRRCDELSAVIEDLGFPPGHFYSPVVDTRDPHVIGAVRTRTSQGHGVTVDTEQILENLHTFARHQRCFPFSSSNQGGHRFHLNNTFFGPHDSLALFSILLEYKPKRVVEVGSGFSSALFLDTDELFLDAQMQLTFIDPSLEQLRSLIRSDETQRVQMIEQKVQDVPFQVFDALESGDILFIDSSHVSKTASDVNHYLFEVLPRLSAGVMVHIHDIFYPFEYPEDWVLNQKRSWNEAYLVRAFLQYNTAFRMIYWSSFASRMLTEHVCELMPLAAGDEGGSLWLRKVL
ncbi:MAG TPA: class I SAM-dependent methyltransferase [Bryobacteraceae bacterium]|nr:class I SAM-dependent methyltransferase [Bryobacteraceae bacterium]